MRHSGITTYDEQKKKISSLHEVRERKEKLICLNRSANEILSLIVKYASGLKWLREIVVVVVTVWRERKKCKTTALTGKRECAFVHITL